MLINQHMLTFFIFTLFLKTCLTQRRIVDGTKVHNEVRFMAYLVKSEHSARAYHGWQCGGAIISPLHILTAAACVIDVDHLYAVIGYNKYVSADALEDDPCTRNRKKKVVKTCAPKAYNVQLTGWTNHDIGIAVLDSPLDFTDATYKIDCSYPPAPIMVNFDPQYEKPDTDVVAMGWGHSEKLRQPHHLQDHNEPFLQEASLLIVERDVCVKKFDFDPAVERVIENDIICVDGQGNLNAEGQELDHGPLHYKCEDNDSTNSSITTNLPNADPNVITENNDDITTITSKKKPRLRENLQNKIIDYYEDDELYDELLKRRDTKGRWRRVNVCRRRMDTRRRGLCQNDHGGPLITWMGVKPIVIGVASTNLYNKSLACISPNIFTSTMSNKWFIKCAVKDTLNDLESRKTCSQMLQREGSRTYEEVSNWIPGAHQKAPMINPQLLPVLSLQMALGSYLQQYQKVQSNVLSIDQMQRQQNIPHNQLLQNRALSNYEKHLLLRQSHKDLKIPNFIQNILETFNKPSNYLQEVTNNERIARYNPAIITDHQQKIPTRHRAAKSPYIETDNQQNAPQYQQNIPHYQQNAPNYQHNAPNYQHNAPNYQHNPVMITKHQQNIPNVRQRATKSQNIKTDYQQKALGFQLHIPHYQHNAPNYQQHPVMATTHQQNIPDVRQKATKRQYIKIDYQQNAPDFQQNIPQYQQNAPHYQHNAPNYQHYLVMMTKNQQNIPVRQKATKSLYIKTDYQQNAPDFQQDILQYQQNALNYQQNIPNYQQNAPHYQHNAPHYQRHPVMVTKHQQNIPNVRQRATKRQYIKIDYQQNAPNYQQNVPHYQHNAPNYQYQPVMVTKHQQNMPTQLRATTSQYIEIDYQQNPPDFQQNAPYDLQITPHYQHNIYDDQNKPVYKYNQARKPAFAVMRTRSLKNMYEVPAPRRYTSKLSPLGDRLVRRRTISWR